MRQRMSAAGVHPLVATAASHTTLAAIEALTPGAALVGGGTAAAMAAQRMQQRVGPTMRQQYDAFKRRFVTTRAPSAYQRRPATATAAKPKAAAAAPKPSATPATTVG